MHKGGQELSQAMHEAMGHGVGARTQMEHGKMLAAGVDNQPEPLFGAAQPAAPLVELQVPQMELKEEAPVQGMPMLTCTGEPGGKSGLSKALRPALRRKGRALEPGPSAPGRPSQNECSDGTAQCCDGRVKGVRQA
jgi:hypothetical protein